MAADPSISPTPNAFVGQQHVYIDGHIIDVATVEHFTYESKITDYPREDGPNVTDNIRPQPFLIKMTCIVSNTPTDDTVIAERNSEDGTASAWLTAYEYLQKIYYLRQPVSVTTSLGTYTSMGMKSLGVPRSAEQGDALFFDVEFAHVTTVKNTRTGKRVASPSGVGPHGKTDAPKPLPAVPTTLGQIIIAQDAVNGVFEIFKHYWLDKDINGWRETATISNDGSYYLVAKGRPFGASNEAFQANPSDTYWQQTIAAAYASVPAAVALGFVPVSSINPYNPFGPQFAPPTKRLVYPIRTSDPWSTTGTLPA